MAQQNSNDLSCLLNQCILNPLVQKFSEDTQTQKQRKGTKTQYMQAHEWP